MERPIKFHETRWLGDKRTQVVYDVDNIADGDAALVDDIITNEVGLCFGPDTLAEARNRGYRAFKGDGSGHGTTESAA